MKIGDIVTRMMAGLIPMKLRVTEITDNRIVCGGYEFDKATGAEIDDACGWGTKFSGSFLILGEK
jgi:hypothetical protein